VLEESDNIVAPSGGAFRRRQVMYGPIMLAQQQRRIQLDLIVIYRDQ